LDWVKILANGKRKVKNGLSGKQGNSGSIPAKGKIFFFLSRVFRLY
jgi:hypothetical protein